VSELFDDDPRAARPARTSGGRSRALLITLGVLVVAVFGLTGFASIYTDRLWYQSAGYGQVFSTMLWTRVVLFLVFGALLGGAVALNIYLAYRFRPLFRPSSREQSNLDRYRDVVTPIRTWLVAGIAVVVGAFAGASGLSNWQTYLLWRNGPDVEATDAYFDKSIGFYIFDLPWYHFVTDFVMATMVISLVAAVVTHYLYGGIRLQASHDRLSGSAQAQLSVLLGLFVLAKGVDYYLDRFDLVTEDNRLFTGMNYTAENAVLPAKNILMVVALLCAVLFFLNVWRRTWQLPSVGLALLALSAILIGMIFPAIVQQFQVKPSEPDKENDYIQANIDATRQAYALTDVAEEDYPASTSLPDSAAYDAFFRTIPLVDPQLVSETFENIQQENRYYSVSQVLDVDRYEIDGTDRALVLGVRELDQDGLPDDARNWSNLHTVYTHGNGIIAAYANQRDRLNGREAEVVDTGTGDGGLEWAQGINPDENDLADEYGDFESRIYYGEQSPDYSVVGQTEDRDVERNLPVPGSELGDATSTTFDGPGDATVGSAFNQLMFALKFGEPNFVLSGRVNDNSKVLYNREPQERVEKVAPWLTVDSDAYPVLLPGQDGEEGRIVWVLDGYTTTDRYPNAQRESFETMIDDAQQVDNVLQTVPTDEINYMRNAVKATVDAYTGEVVLYAWDEQDPLLQAWRNVFPGSVRDKDEIPEALLDHLRYPEDFFKVQRYQYARYHVTGASDWYNNSDRWQVPTDPQQTSRYQAPYRLFTQAGPDADASPQYSLTSVYVPFGRNNLASFVSVNSDATSEGYGQISVLRIEGADDASEDSEQARGPGQVANDFQSDGDVQRALLQYTQQGSGADVDYGNLLTLPVNDGFLYVQPVYVARSTTTAAYPQLQLVLSKYGGDVGVGTTFQESLQDLFGGTTTSPGTEEPGTGGEDPGTGGQPGTEPPDDTLTLQEQLDRELDRAITASEAAQAALAAQDQVGYAQALVDVQDALEEVARLRNLIDGGGTAASAGSTGGPTDAPTDASTEDSAG
jgi:uncharacterized protein